MTRTTIIAAMARNHVIGTAAGLPWHLPADLKRFRTLTLGKPVVMGRKTFDHIGRPLPGRPNVVLTHRSGFAADGVRVARSVSEALVVAREEADAVGADEVMIIGGGEVYRAFFPLADRLHLTVVDGEFEGTATFPADLLAGFPHVVSDRQPHPADAKNPHPYTFWQLDRVDATVPAVTPLPAWLGVA